MFGVVGGVSRAIIPCFGDAEWKSLEEGMREPQQQPHHLAGSGQSFQGGVMNFELGPNPSLAEVNDDLVRVIVSVIDRCEWSQISNADGISVFRTQLPAALSIGGRVLGSAAKVRFAEAVLLFMAALLLFMEA
eukprot:1784467-Rhodomonas_salina.1